MGNSDSKAIIMFSLKTNRCPLKNWGWKTTFLAGRCYLLPTLPETNSSSLKIGHPKRKQTSSNHQFSRDMLVSGSVGQTGLFQVFFLFSAGAMRYASTGLDVMSSIRGAFFSCDAKLLSW